ncbi:MAG: hypothetical protein AAFU69_04845 [Pseudomonadota bacterium]
MSRRATRGPGWDNSTLIIPNSVLAKQTYRNLHGADHAYAPWYTVTLPVDINPRLAKALLLDLALKCKSALKSPLPSVRLADSTTVPYRYSMRVHYRDYASVFPGREEFFRSMHYALRETGIQNAPFIQEMRVQRTKKTEIKAPYGDTCCRAWVSRKSLTRKKRNTDQPELFFDPSILLAESATSSSVDVVKSDLIETSVVDDKGKSRPVETLSSGDYFGLASMVVNFPSF